MEKTTLSNGIAIAQAHYDTIVSRGKKFMDRQVPVYIRRNLWIPCYMTFGGHGEKYLHIIQLPNEYDPKVHFQAYLLIENEST